MAENPTEMQKKREETSVRSLSLISFLINALVPVIAFSAALVMLDIGIQNNWQIVIEMAAPVRFPQPFYHLNVVGSLFEFLSTIQYLRVILIFFMLGWILFAGLFSMLNAYLYKAFGPSLYSKVDVPFTVTKNK